MGKLTFPLTKKLSKASSLTYALGALRFPDGFILSGLVGLPGAPTIGTATAASTTTVSVTFTAPVSNGGSAITGYTVTSSPGGFTGTGASSPIVVSGLTIATAYTFTVTATNAIGTGPASGASNSATTMSYATLNPSAKGTPITLSNGNLTATCTNNASNVRGTVGKAAGKWYWEMTVVEGAGNIAGISTSAPDVNTDITAQVGIDVYNGGDGSKYLDSVNSAYGASFTTAAVIGFALDMDAGTLICYKTNSSQGTMVTGLSDTFYPVWGSGSSGFQQSATFNFGATALTYTPPVGYNTGLYG